MLVVGIPRIFQSSDMIRIQWKARCLYRQESYSATENFAAFLSMIKYFNAFVHTFRHLVSSKCIDPLSQSNEVSVPNTEQVVQIDR